MKPRLLKIKIAKPRLPKDKHIIVIVAVLAIFVISVYFTQNEITSLKTIVENLTREKDKNLVELQKIAKELEEMKNEDQYLRNEKLQEDIKNIETNYDKAVSVYENLLELKEKTDKTEEFDELFAKSLTMLSERNYASASSTLAGLSSKIKTEEDKIAAEFKIPENIPQNNAPPGAGYSRQRVTTDAGTFMVSLIAADMGSTRVIVDTASNSDCGNECPVLPLASYISRNGAFAGVNGSYFCPATYPSCAGKTNSFDLLAMNKNKTYFNSGNNVYSGNPMVIFGEGYIRFVSSGSQWGRDTSPNGVLMNYPLLLMNSEMRFGGDDDPKKGSRGNRSFVANKGGTVYLGVVHSATVAESARVMKALGMENAINLDNGGSTALWSGGYKVGPGRNLPNVILFVRK